MYFVFTLMYFVFTLMYFVFTRIPGDSYCRRFGVLVLSSRDVF